MVTVYLGLGSNLDQPIQHIKTALIELKTLPQTKWICASRLYHSAPMGPQDQPEYINAVAKINTALSANTLLEYIQYLEEQHQRVRTRHWGERTLDIDILLYGDATIKTPQLTIPHPGLTEREFVLYPLYEIAPDLQLPSGVSLASCREHCPLQS